MTGIQPIDRYDSGCSSKEDIVQFVFHRAMEDCNRNSCSIAPVLESCVRQSVEHIWETAKLKSFIPLLSLSSVNECIRNGTCQETTALVAR